jgi:hypothetical protein
MAWNIDEEAARGDKAEMIPAGPAVDLRIAKVMPAKKPTRGGDRQIHVVFEDTDAREAMLTYQVEGKARWKLAALLKGLGYSSKDMEAAGFEPTMLLTKEIANQWLKDRTLVGDVSYRQYEGKDYADVKPHMPAQPEPEYADAQPDNGSTYGKPPPEDDSIPF